MALSSLGYVGIQSSKLDDWATYGPRLLGLELVERTNSLLRFRMDDRKQRLIVRASDDEPSAFGWEVESGDELEALAARLDAAQIAVAPLSAVAASERCISRGIRFADPAGTRLEAFVRAETADAPFTPGRAISGFRTGALGMGHAVLHVERVDDLQWFYQDVLGFRLSDFAIKPFKAFFFHLNPRHHSLAMIETGKRGIHHIMVELKNLDDVGQGYDIAQAERRVSTTLGRHTNDFMTSFYARTPNEFLVEYGWGGRTIDPDTWQPHEMTYGPSLWGHERTWLPAEQLAATRAVRAKAAADGLHMPVQVSDGNFATGPSGCPWWEATKRA
jgi:2,3-dihydroxybiphenyl 1,2-dioxygenase